MEKEDRREQRQWTGPDANLCSLIKALNLRDQWDYQKSTKEGGHTFVYPSETVRLDRVYCMGDQVLKVNKLKCDSI